MRERERKGDATLPAHVRSLRKIQSKLERLANENLQARLCKSLKVAG